MYKVLVLGSVAYSAVFGVFMEKKLDYKSSTTVWDGEQTYNFTFVTNLADAFILSA